MYAGLYYVDKEHKKLEVDKGQETTVNSQCFEGQPFASATVFNRPVPIVLVKCWNLAHWNANKLLKITKNPKNCDVNFKSCFL